MIIRPYGGILPKLQRYPADGELPLGSQCLCYCRTKIFALHCKVGIFCCDLHPADRAAQPARQTGIPGDISRRRDAVASLACKVAFRFRWSRCRGNPCGCPGSWWMRRGQGAPCGRPYVQTNHLNCNATWPAIHTGNPRRNALYCRPSSKHGSISCASRRFTAKEG